MWLAAWPKTFFSEGIQKLVQHWTRHVGKQGDCVEKYRLVSSVLQFYSF
jgi:hypothetical protein